VPIDNENDLITSNCNILFWSDSILFELFSCLALSWIKGVAGSNIIISSSFIDAFGFSKELFMFDICSIPEGSFWLQHYINFYIRYIFILRLLHPFFFENLKTKFK